MKKMIIGTLILSVFVAVKENNYSNHLYAKSGVVTEVNENEDYFIITDKSGNEWAYEGVEDWFINDSCSMVMYNNNTESIYDDEIVSIRYEG